jgi:hypothetical protein
VACFVLLLVCLKRSLGAQACPHDSSDIVQLQGEVEHAADPNVIYRAAAIAQDKLVPALRRLSKPGMPLNSVAGAAQVSLARLGDKEATEQLEQELNRIRSPFDVGAVNKLVAVGTDKALSILMTFLVVRFSDSSLVVDLQDASEDLRQEIVKEIASRLQVGPLAPNQTFSVSLQDWVTWWNQVKGQAIVLSISTGLHDPYLRCLARKVEWGFPDAIFDLATSKDPQVLPVLRKLAEFGDHRGRSFNLKTIRGRAEFGLAQMGDQEELATIKGELNGPGYTGAIEELRLLGGKDAVTALINAFDSPDFLPQYRGFKKTYQRELNKRDQDIQKALIKMVVSPPETKMTPEGREKWKDWWAKNKGSAQFTVPPVKSYE